MPVMTEGPAMDKTNANVSKTPLRDRFDALLASVGWTQENLSQDQLKLLAGLITERQRLLSKLQEQEYALERAQSVADHDGLIPVYNRRAFMRELSRQLSFCYRYESQACLIYMDLDHFKEINDRYGHSTGDTALKKFGEILIAHTRESDLIGRLGGDEFAVLLINAGIEAAEQKAASFKEDVAKLRFGSADAPLGFGLSCGVIAWERGETAERLVDRADEAMYREKHGKPSQQASA